MTRCLPPRLSARWASALAACLLWLPPLQAAAQTRPIEGHENWKLGMTQAEALAAEPRAEPIDCDADDCLRYSDHRFASADITVSAHFTAADVLDVIVIDMAVKPGENLCRRLYAQLAAFYTAAHGQTAPISQDAWVWTSPQATLSLLTTCKANEAGNINILFQSTGAAGIPGRS
jgi:hypothetical protein